MPDYVWQAGTVWFLGFFPAFEIYVAVPSGIALGLDYASVLFWAIFGNFAPVLLINFGYERLLRIERVRAWLQRIESEKLRERVNRYGTWFVLVITPWTGVWAMSVTAKLLQMQSRQLLLYSFISITIYAIATAVLIATGVDIAT